MRIQPSDIYINNGALWLSQDCIMQTCGIDDRYMRKVRTAYKRSVPECRHSRDILPDTGKSWRWGRIDNTYFYAYNNIPNKKPAEFRSKLPGIQELMSVLSGAVKHPETDFETYFTTALKEDYKQHLHLYNECTPIQKKNLAKCAALMMAAVQYINTQQVNTSKYHFFNQLAVFNKNNNVPYASKHPRVLKGKIMALKGGAALSDVIYLPRTGNSNAAKEFVHEEIKSWVLQMKETGRNYTDSFIIRKVRQMCALTNIPVPSKRWLGINITQQHNVRYLTAVKNYGSGSRQALKYTGYQRFKNALFAGDCWQVDGTRVNILPHKGEATVKRKDGSTETVEKLRYLYIVAVRDVHSGDILGYTYTYNENRWEVHEALKMAVKEAGYLPYEIVFDKFPGHNSAEGKQYLSELEHMGVKVTLSSSKTVKQNLERWFGTMQTVFLQESKYYYGEGVKSSRPYAHRSEEYMKKATKEANKEGFDWQAACIHYDEIIAAYRRTPYKEWSKEHSHIDASPMDLHRVSEKPDVRILEEQDYYFLFGLRPVKPVKFKGQGLIELTIRHVRHCYRCTDYEIVSQYPEVMIAYDLDDLSHIHIYKPSDNVIKQYLGRVELEQQGQRYGSKAQWGVVSENAAKIKRLEQQQQEEREQAIAVGQDIMTILNPMSVHKHDKEEAESQYLNDQFGIDDDEGEDLNIDITSNY